MIVGGLAEIAFGVKAERRRLEGIAKPLTAVERAVRTTATRAAEVGARAAEAGGRGGQAGPRSPRTA